ncbi:MAG: hypothetical protein AAB654_09660 [Acidobacteriota bacterium]
MLDSSWNLIGTVPVACQLVQPPRISTGGDFSLALRAVKEEDAHNLEGRVVMCTMKLGSDSGISFESRVEGGRLAFTASGLPELEQEVTPPMEVFEFCLAP